MPIYASKGVALGVPVKVLVADPDPATAETVRSVLGGRLHVLAVADGLRALQVLNEEEVAVLLAETRLPGLTGLELLRRGRALRPELQVILLTAFGTVEDAVEAMRAGAADFKSKPFAADELALAIERALERQRLVSENQALRSALDDRLRIDNMVATDPRMQEIFKVVKTVAQARTTVLITGESGTGKTLLARAIHNLSDRRHAPFVEVNCGALPETLLESELFGHVKGAFTGAIRDRPGKFEAANGGTIFLDEIGTSSPGFQVRLLRVLQDRTLERVGDSQTIPVDVRVILATNVDLERAVREGTFREDLYYRIHVVTLEMPPLRERRADVPFLAEHFLRRFRAETGKRVHGINRAAMDLLVHYHWPGNVRQLENVIERAVVLCEGEEITPEDLPAALRTPAGAVAPDPTALVGAGEHLQPLRKALEGPERLILTRALQLHGGNREATARALGINRSTLFNKLRKFGIK
ncbi:MAG TPA: sigma-54 dependent transcriptional regulator [Planctomycetota bacterium]|nr:sigma-54 dependent transcriptional regulator [Planctomycetota bacterium]